MSYFLGKGISLRRVFLHELADRLVHDEESVLSRLNWVELVPENYIGRGGEIRRALFQIAERLPAVLHSTSLSIGSMDPLDWEYLGQVKKLGQELKSPWISDHLCYSSVNQVQFHDLLPLPFNEKAIRHVVERIRQVQEYLELPFALENPSFYAVMPQSEMNEAQFIREVIQRSKCHLLLDVNNIFVNCFNHSEDPHLAVEEYLDTLPLDRVLEVHIAGHKKIELAGKKILLDTHGAKVPADVSWVLRELHRRCSVQSLLLEREQDVPPLEELLDEVSGLWETIYESPSRGNAKGDLWSGDSAGSSMGFVS